MTRIGISLAINRGGGVGFTPAALSPRVWLDASDGGTLFTNSGGTTAVSSDGDAVARISDKSGNGFHFINTDPLRVPVYKVNIQKGRSVVRFDGVNDALTCSSVSMPGGVFHCFAVVRVTSKTSFGGFLTYQVSNSAGGINFRQNGTTGRLELAKGNIGDVAIGTTDISGSGYCLIEGLMSSPNYSVLLNGSSEGTGTNATTLDASNHTTLFAGNNAGLQWTNGDFCELVLFDSQITGTNLANLRTYLSNRWV